MEVIKVNSWFAYIREHPSFTGCLIDRDNNKAWYQNGKRHREDGHPAVENADGTKLWYKNGERHREDGPACEFASGDKWWFLNGNYYNEQEWIIAMRKIKLEKVLKEIDC